MQEGKSKSTQSCYNPLKFIFTKKDTTGVQDIYGRTSLHCAVLDSNITKVNKLLSVMKLEDILKVRLGGDTALHIAIDQRYTPVIISLLTKAPELTSIQNDIGSTCLHQAIYRGNMETIILILNVMTEENIIKVTKTYGHTVLHLTLQREYFTDEAKNSTNIIRRNIVAQLLAKCPKLATIADKSGQTPLHWAASKGYVSIVVDLLDILSSEDITICSVKGSSAMDYAQTLEISQLIELGSFKDYELLQEIP